ncbi:MAG TPA: cytochrome c [bacterium]|nr:cytochrome c [bacterium]
MKIRTALFFVLLLIANGLCFANRDENMEPADGFFLPGGDAAAGQKAFTALKCNTCHWVQNNMELNPPVVQKAGPMLGEKQAGYAAGWIANSIVSPSHTIALDSDGEAEGNELSRMGDFSESMTVRQMINIVAYIKSLGEKNVSKNDSYES